MKALALDFFGIVAALALGAAVFYFGKENGGAYLIMLLIFLLLSVLVTNIGIERKSYLGLYEGERGFSNVFSNGIIPLLSVFVSPGAFACAVAAVASDKFSSEIGALNGMPYFLAGLKKVPHGTSGAVTFLGCVSGIFGAFIMAAFSFFLLPFTFPQLLVITFAGFIGGMADSVAGVFETRNFGNKATSNIVGSLIGALLGHVLIY